MDRQSIDKRRECVADQTAATGRSIEATVGVGPSSDCTGCYRCVAEASVRTLGYPRSSTK